MVLLLLRVKPGSVEVGVGMVRGGLLSFGVVTVKLTRVVLLRRAA